jgi:hypothetical protein
MSPTIVNIAGGIKKPRRLRRKPKFLCRTCKGNHLTCLCPATAEIPEVWGSPKGSSYSEAFVVSPHLFPPLIDTVVTSLQSSPELTPVVEGDMSPIPITVHPLQPRVEEVVVPVPSLVTFDFLMEGDTTFNHVINIPDPAPSKRERIFI